MENKTNSGRPSMRDVTGDEDEKHFGPGKEDAPRSRKPANDDDEDSYNTPKNSRSRNDDTQEPARRSSSRNEDPTEDDVKKGKDTYSEDDFKGEVVGGGEGVLVPEDVYEVICIDVIPSMMKDKFKNNVEVPKVKFKFRIINDQDFENVEVSRILNRNFAQKSNLVEWYTKITGEAVEKGNSIDIRKCKNKECRISVTVYVPEGKSEKRNKIVDILSKKRKAA